MENKYLPICHPILEKGEGTMEELREVMSDEDIESLILLGYIKTSSYPLIKKKSIWKKIKNLLSLT